MTVKNNFILTKKIVLYFLPVFFLSPVLIIGGCLFLAGSGAWGPLPDFKQLENPETNLATEIISSDNKIFLFYFT